MSYEFPPGCPGIKHSEQLKYHSVND